MGFLSWNFNGDLRVSINGGNPNGWFIRDNPNLTWMIRKPPYGVDIAITIYNML